MGQEIEWGNKQNSQPKKLEGKQNNYLKISKKGKKQCKTEGTSLSLSQSIIYTQVHTHTHIYIHIMSLD